MEYAQETTGGEDRAAARLRRAISLKGGPRLDRVALTGQGGHAFLHHAVDQRLGRGLLRADNGLRRHHHFRLCRLLCAQRLCPPRQNQRTCRQRRSLHQFSSAKNTRAGLRGVPGVSVLIVALVSCHPSPPVLRSLDQCVVCIFSSHKRFSSPCILLGMRCALCLTFACQVEVNDEAPTRFRKDAVAATLWRFLWQGGKMCVSGSN